MKIEKHEIERISIEEFADRHGLVMEIHERDLPAGNRGRYYACFKSSAIMEGRSILASATGNGSTPKKAIADYAKRISRRQLVLNAYGSDRKEINVPKLL
jgi:hypothetical protein